MTGHTAQTHRKIRKNQNENQDAYHHPEEKIEHLNLLADFIHGEILEVFAGQGNLTRFYLRSGNVEAMTKETHGDSFDAIYKLRAKKKKYDVIDVDSYGYPDKFFPIVFEMMKPVCLLIFTFPIVGVNCLNGIMEQHYINFWRSDRPTIGDVTGVITDQALREWYLASLLEVKKIKRIWRFAFICKRKKATELCTTKNRASPEAETIDLPMFGEI